MYGSLNRVYKLGGKWVISKKIACGNKFWKSVLKAGVYFARVKYLAIILKFCNLVFGIILNCQEKFSFFKIGTISRFN